MFRTSKNNQTLKKGMSSLMSILVVFTQAVLPVMAAEPVHPMRRAPHGHAPKKMPHNPIGAVSAQERAAMSTARKHQFVLSPAPTDAEIFRSRSFSEPLVAMTGSRVAGENAELAKALIAFKAKNDPEDVSAITSFMDTHPNSRWNAALALNVGLLRRETGYISEALALLNTSWQQSKSAKGKEQSQLAQRALSELLFLEGMLGRLDEMKVGLAEIGNRPMVGSSSERVSAARDAVQVMQKAPGDAFRCGPFAVQTLMELKGTPVPADSFIRKAKSTSKGNSLLEVKQLAQKGGLNMQIAKRSPGADVLLPAVMHWRAGHYGALTELKDSKFHIEDPTFDRNGQLWVSKRAIDSESDGFFLVPAGELPAGWEPVSDSVAANIFGKGYMQTSNENKGSDHPNQCTGPNCGCGGMAVATAWTMQAELNIRDEPLSYNCPIGPDMRFAVNYSQNEIEQPATFTFSNLGPNWSTNWVSWISIDGSNNATVHLRDGGVEPHDYTGNSGDPYDPDVMSVAELTVPSAGVYHRELPDGSIEVFDLDDGNDNYFMTEVIDPQGNSATVAYDVDFRIQSVTDANGNVTTFDHASNNPLDPDFFLISAIHDPFGRDCSFSYDGNYFLEAITDAVGIESTFTYDVGSAFCESLTTPYGTTDFDSYTISTGYVYPGRGLNFAYPDGTTSVIEHTLDHENETHYWDREAMARYPNDPTNRIFSHCRKTTWFAEGFSANVAPIARASKNPLESQIAYTYPNQISSGFYDTLNRPSAITQRNDYNLKARFSITGTITPGDILSVRIWNNLLPGAVKTVSYTVQSGDTANDILEELGDLVNNDSEFLKRGIYAEMDDGYLVVTPEDVYYSYPQALTSGGATETFTAELEQDWSRSPVNIVFGGTPTAGDIVYLHSAYPPTYPVFSYTVVSGDTLETIAQKVAYMLTDDSFSRSHNCSFSASGNKIFCHLGWGVGAFWANYSSRRARDFLRVCRKQY